MLKSFRDNIPVDNKQAIEDSFPPEPCHKLLKQVDPQMAEFLHEMDKRKVVNALFKYFKMLAV